MPSLRRDLRRRGTPLLRSSRSRRSWRRCPCSTKTFQGYAHYFYENKLKEAVAAAFERYENRLNEIRSGSISPTVRAASGHPLVYRLFAEAELVRPYPALGAKDSYEKGLTGILSGALEWIRNPYTHQKHELPDLTPSRRLRLWSCCSWRAT
jgi:hypothetical protein